MDDIIKKLLGKRVESGSTVALKVQGDQMRHLGMIDGDFVLIDTSGLASNGDLVVAVIPGGTAVMRRFYRFDDDRIALKSLLPEEPDIVVDRCEIRGVVKGVVRRY